VLSLVLVTGVLADKTKINRTDQAAARHDVLHLSDLPTTLKWTAGNINAGGSDPSFSCAGYDPNAPGLTDTGRASSTFTSPGIVVSSNVGLFATSGMVALDWKRTFVPMIVPCLRKAFEHGAGGKVDVVSVDQVGFPQLASRTVAYRVISQISLGGKPIRGVFDTIALAGDRTEVLLLVVGAVGPPADEASGEADMTIVDLRLAEILTRRAFPPPPTPLAA